MKGVPLLFDTALHAAHVCWCGDWLQVGTPEEDVNLMEDRKTKVTLAVQEVRDSLVGELDRIRGARSRSGSLDAPMLLDMQALLMPALCFVPWTQGYYCKVQGLLSGLCWEARTPQGLLGNQQGMRQLRAIARQMLHADKDSQE
jgi:hypothetical protein